MQNTCRSRIALPCRARSEARFLSIDAGLGLKIADCQTHAAIKLADALSALDAAGMWKSVYEARDCLEQLRVGNIRPSIAGIAKAGVT